MIKICYISIFVYFLLQGLPTCPVSLVALRTRLPDLSCWGLPQFLQKEDTEGATGNNNNNNSQHNNNNNSANSKYSLTPLHRFYKQQRKMPGFRGRRGLCGCFQVSFFILYICPFSGENYLCVAVRKSHFHYNIMCFNYITLQFKISSLALPAT